MGRRSRPTDLIMKKILEFHGNGSVVEVEGLKRQAGEAPSTKLQASSTRSVRQIVARQDVLLTEAPSAKPQAPSAMEHGS